jgi:penicillin-binding protein 1A
MLNKAVEEGTGRRSLLPGVKSAGKTGTTNNYRDAWFVGYTGNYVGGVWVGNDDYAPTNRMTGGSLPAMTWRAVMAYAHQGIELKNIPGVTPGPTPPAVIPAAKPGETLAAAPPRPVLLTARGAQILNALERSMESASQALAKPGVPLSASPGTSQQRRTSLPPSGAVAAAPQSPTDGRSGN